MVGEVSGGLVTLDAAERDTLLLGDFSEHLGGLRIKLIAQEVGHRQPAINAHGVGDCSDALGGVRSPRRSPAPIVHTAQHVFGEVDSRQRAVDADQRGDHDGRGNTEALV